MSLRLTDRLQAEALAGVAHGVVERRQLVGLAGELVTKLAADGDAADRGRGETDIELPCVPNTRS